ncbi:BolA family transcriptional regulator [Gluconacetobacter tumulicola]|uniref:BolA family transcriptional regulator n=1 Tax=Gluconacetobacter tumulicola TaxID=1017177 RepID=A0A7W4P5K2_9PROT|nr:BolA family protein [Gluconacetobacter tumulicola]MBB2178152.1 BolA family transcriptional regulator [Gluconacetobacter tumulicola]
MAEDRRVDRIGRALHAQLAPSLIEIEDDSGRHADHAGMRGAPAGGETHFNVLVVSAAFDGLARVQRSRLVHELLAPEFASGLHALSLTLRTPAEQARIAGA